MCSFKGPGNQFSQSAITISNGLEHCLLFYMINVLMCVLFVLFSLVSSAQPTDGKSRCHKFSPTNQNLTIWESDSWHLLGCLLIRCQEDTIVSQFHEHLEVAILTKLEFSLGGDRIERQQSKNSLSCSTEQETRVCGHNSSAQGDFTDTLVLCLVHKR